VLLKIKIYQQITIKIFNIEFTAADVSSKWPSKVGVFPPHLRAETDPVSEKLSFLLPRISDGGQSPKTQ
jgi:hypothetical protein